MATERMEESWSRIKTQIQNIWGEFDEKEMKKARGDLREMVSLIHEKTGEDVQQIIQKISTIV
ncbi:MAG: general stress protein CsbD [Rhodothermales bacterium]